jgi:hypothetical protein
MTVTTTKLTRAAGIAAVASGLLFIVIQFVHPAENLDTVTTTAWVVVALLTMAMAVLGLIGTTGIYLRQVKQTGVLGLIGYLLFGTFYLFTIPFTFIESFVLPTLATQAPAFVTDFLAIFSGGPSDGSLVLELASPVVGAAYLLGGLLFGVALFRARILARWAAILLSAGTVLTLVIPFVPHTVGRLAAIPVGVALVGLGYSLWREQRTPTARPLPSAVSSQLDPAGAK